MIFLMLYIILEKLYFLIFMSGLNFWEKCLKKTNYDWYIKNRPNYEGKFQLYQPHTNEVIKKFVEKI